MTEVDVRAKLALLEGIARIAKEQGLLSATVDGVSVTLPVVQQLPVKGPALVTVEEDVSERRPLGMDDEDLQTWADRAAEVGDETVQDAYESYAAGEGSN